MTTIITNVLFVVAGVYLLSFLSSVYTAAAMVRSGQYRRVTVSSVPLVISGVSLLTALLVSR